jgi:hypothetical protein
VIFISEQVFSTPDLQLYQFLQGVKAIYSWSDEILRTDLSCSKYQLFTIEEIVRIWPVSTLIDIKFISMVILLSFDSAENKNSLDT